MSTRWRIALLLCGSGMCALIYQIAWLRELRLVFGASTPASAAVLAVFMGGLGFGSIFLSGRAERSSRPLALYANLELLVATTAALSPALLWLLRRAYVALGGTSALGMGGGTVARLLLSALVLLPPTFLMGGTLPAAARAAEQEQDRERRHTALLYGANTLGAVLGAAFTTFVLLEVFGTKLTLWLGCGVNALIGLAARAIDRTLSEVPTAASERSAEEPRVTDRVTWFVLVAAAAVGFVFLLLELAWYRMLAPLLGGSTYTFGLILAVALFGVGAGGLFYARRRGGREPTLAAFALTCALEAVAVAIPYALGDSLALLALVLRPLGTAGLWGHALGWTVVTAVCVLPAAVVAGYQFPLLIALLGRGREGVARHVGLAYGWNTGGAIAGSLLGGFLLLPWLTAPGTWRAAVALLGVLGMAALVFDARDNPRPRAALAPGLFVLVAFGAIVFPEGPTAVWRHSPIGVGRADDVTAMRTRNEVRRWMNEQRYGVTWEAEGRESSVALSRLYDTSFVVNGKTDGSALGDATTQIMGGLLGTLVHGDVKRALVIGLGTGCTAGWIAAVPAVERVDVVEIEPAILHVARELSAVNAHVLDNAKVALLDGDAREILLTTDARYDLIFSEPSNPYRAGIASLFTREFYEEVAARLEPGGVFVQWVQGYDIDAESIAVIYATLGSVFGSVASWQADVSDLLLIARADGPPLEVARLAAAIGEEPYRSALMGVWRVEDVEGLLAHHVGTPDLARLVALEAGDARVNTDDRNLLEFALARALGKPSGYSVGALHAAALRRGLGRPTVVGAVDWARADATRLSMTMGRDSQPPPVELDELTPADRARHRAFRAWAAGSYPAVLSAWAEVGAKPASAIEHMVVADALGAAGRVDEAEPLLTHLGERLPTEALAIRARGAFFADRPERALTLVVEALTAYRSDPWPTPELFVRTLDVAQALASRHPPALEPLLGVLAEPFVADALRLHRQRALAEIAALHDDPGRCTLALAPFERHPPWDEPFLSLRARCYARASHPLGAAAEADLALFSADDATRIEGGLLPPLPNP